MPKQLALIMIHVCFLSLYDHQCEHKLYLNLSEENVEEIILRKMKTTYIIVIGRITNYCEMINYEIFKEDVFKRLPVADEAKRARRMISRSFLFRNVKMFHQMSWKASAKSGMTWDVMWSKRTAFASLRHSPVNNNQQFQY